MNDINDQLLDLYQREIKNLQQIQIDTDFYDGPHLAYAFDDYSGAKKKIVFVGQEPNGWAGSISHNVDDLLHKYKDFKMCDAGGKSYTAFWEYIYDFKNTLLNTGNAKDFMWLNVSKFCEADTGGTIQSDDDFYLLNENFNVLVQEIKILNPDIVIFFTGSNWDYAINHLLENTVKFNEVHNSVAVKEVAKLTSPHLPFYSYRLQHPRYLRTKKKWSNVELVLEHIQSAQN